jgi:MazG-like family
VENGREAKALLRSRSGRERFGEEIADVLIFGLQLCHEADLDPAAAVRQKLRQNAKKYPVRLAKRRALQYTDLRVESAREVSKRTAKRSARLAKHS